MIDNRECKSQVTASNDAISGIGKALRRHVDAATLETIVNELLDVADKKPPRRDRGAGA